MEPVTNETPKHGTLYVVSTPIGNKKDITYRAAEILQNADIVVGEEIKEASRVLMHLSLTKEIELLNEHNESEKTAELYEYLVAGKTLALISDCGTPIFADPGLNLVKMCIQNQIEVVAVPGASSIMTALVTSGFTLKQFLYAGFLKRTGDERDDEILQLAKVRKTVALMDTPYRLKVLLEAFTRIIPERRAYIGMNLTLPSETHHYGTFSELYEKFRTEKFKAEYVLIFEGLDNTDKEEKARLSKMISLRKTHGVKQSRMISEDGPEDENLEEDESISAFDEKPKKRIIRATEEPQRRPDRFERERSDSQESGEDLSEDRPRRENSYSDRPRREGSFSDRPKREGSSFGDRPRREGSFSDRPKREGSSFGDRPRREGSFSDRPKREGSSFGDRPRREGSFSDRPKREGSSFGDRPRREGSFSDRPKREGSSFGDRPRREGSYSDRPKREGSSFGDRPRREGSFSDRPKREGSFSDRPKREGSFSDRPKREGSSFGDRPRREGSFSDRPKREGSSFGDRPRREGSFSDRPKREGSSFGDRPRREGSFSDRPKREGSSFGDRPRGGFDRDKPASREGRERPSGDGKFKPRRPSAGKGRPSSRGGKPSGGSRRK